MKQYIIGRYAFSSKEDLTFLTIMVRLNKTADGKLVKLTQNRTIGGKALNKQSSFERFCSFDAMYDASYKVCRNVRWKDSVINFEENRIDIILRTEEDLRNSEYLQLAFSCFSVIERGKQRDIRACHINDRLVQNSLCEEVLLPELTPKFIYDNCATLKGKGIDFALERVKRHLQAAHRQYGFGNAFYGARVDIKKYFDSIDHDSLRKIARKVIKEDDIYELVSYFIGTFSFSLTKDKEPIPNKNYYVTKNKKYIRVNPKRFKPNTKYYEYKEKSLGLGSQTSQLLALLTLNEIDHFIKEKLHIKYYGRYMDDLYLLHDDSKYLNYCLDEIEKKLQEIGLEMNRKKTNITKIEPIHSDNKKKAPFKYLKWDFYLTETNAIIQIPFKKKIVKERRKLRKMSILWRKGVIPTADIQQHYQGWRAHISKGTTFYILQDMDNYFHSLFKGVDII